MSNSTRSYMAQGCAFRRSQGTPEARSIGPAKPQASASSALTTPMSTARRPPDRQLGPGAHRAAQARPGGDAPEPSAGSGELLCERRQERAAIVVAQPLRQLRAGELALRLDHGALAVRPARLDRIQPRALARQAADQEAAPGAGGLDLPVVDPGPGADLAADVPGGVVPDQHQDPDALG